MIIKFKPLYLKRLTLRKFTPDDFEAVQSYAGITENVIYMLWGPNTAEQTREFIDHAIGSSEKEPCDNFQYAAVQNETRKLIGACNLSVTGNEGEIGWILHRDYWKQGYGTEMGAGLLEYGFGELGLDRIIAHCDAENYGSYRVMEKIGMKRTHLDKNCRPPNKNSNRPSGDELTYEIKHSEWKKSL